MARRGDGIYQHGSSRLRELDRSLETLMPRLAVEIGQFRKLDEDPSSRRRHLRLLDGRRT